MSGKGVVMADAKEVLDMMRETAMTRIRMLKEGVTFHDNARRAYYLQQYEEKVRAIDQLNRRIAIRLVRPGEL
jgi:hypothetical protein